MQQSPQDIEIENYDYPLPDERIATHPLAVRDACKLLLHRNDSLSDHTFKELPGLLPADAMMVFNNTRVINARLKMTKPSGAQIEIFCLEPFMPADYEQNFGSRHSCSWQALVGNSKRWKEGALTMQVQLADGKQSTLSATRDGQPDGVVSFEWTGDASFSDIIAAAGQIPIPPYLNRKSEESDATDYQTVYSRIEGSVAAPTAGLHFTPELLQSLDAAGVKRRNVTLHVGAGTFRPVKSDRIGDHDMHSEFITVDIDTIRDIASQLTAGKPIIAVGTTSVRTLESLYHAGRLMSAGKWNGEVPQWCPYDSTIPDISPDRALHIIISGLESAGNDTFMAHTRIIIAPGYTYRIVNGMVTNFHQPKSTLLLLIAALLGDKWRSIYAHALAKGYRFLSYGDACLFLESGI